MKILQVTAVDFTIKKFLTPLIDASKNEGFTVDIACNCGDISLRLKEQGYKLHHIPFSRNLNILSHIKNIYRLVKLLKREKYDILHAHTPVASIISRLAGRIARVPTIIYTAHGFYFHENMNPIVYKVAYYLEKIWGNFFSDYLFFQSKEDYELALKDKFNVPDRLLHIGNGVSSDIFEPSLFSRIEKRRQFGIGDEDVTLTFVGRLVKEKGISELLEAFNIIKRNHKKVKMLIVGGSVEGDRDSISIENILSSFPSSVKNDVYILGLRDDIAEILVASDIFILPSYREGLPRSIIEAMAMGKPIIATDIRGCREEVVNGYNGYLCNPKDSKDLANKIDMLLTSPGNIEIFGSNSREIFMREFDENVVIEKQIEIFRMVKREGEKNV
jgi:glycosyltransferase involved in cell wall biosynthesis